ncbi:peroxidase [Lentzea tibetensis]|uniref:Peroxidase n=1 Tax=Lentzea tibetensis TaxID=2591470 RepID=A0A563EU37_9PSEU|nr:peroxidase family protein [Lentzea tibetensis]TWP51237.1 peroxidase [Lentzea tibetensis]
MRKGNRHVVVVTAAALALLGPGAPVFAEPAPLACADTLVRTLDGSCNNLLHPEWGKTNTPYLRVAPANYADGIARPASGPSSRFVSNRLFNDTSQNLFSERGVSQWGFVWGQFMDHTFGLRQEAGGENSPISFDARDPLEEFRNDLGSIGFMRTPAAPGTGTTTTREQLNTIDSYIDGSSVYGPDVTRLEWMREGPVDGTLANNGARLLLDKGLLPRRDSRGDAAKAPVMAIDGLLRSNPSKAMVAGDVRANENIALTATHTLFALEHNRIVNALPRSLSERDRFEIARRVVGAEQQFITYTEFLPSMGVALAPYRGYNANVNPSLSNEFAVVGYRAHSFIHGELEPIAPEGTYTEAQLAAFERQGIEVEHEDGEVVLVVPLNVAFFNPNLLGAIGLGPVLKGIGAEPEYKNDEQIDNQLRSVLFQIPVPGNPGCLDGPELPKCFRGVVDLGAIDIARGRDHGMPAYNDLRRAYGLAPKTSFHAITGESSSNFPNDPEINQRDPINDPDIIDFVKLRDGAGNVVPLDVPDAADGFGVTGTRRAGTAARLKAMYGDVNKLDAFVGMSAETHARGNELGELQKAIWKKQFENLRDGDRFFYLNDPALAAIESRYGISYRNTLGDVINMNTDADVSDDVFAAEIPVLPAWANATAYAVNDVTVYNHRTYVCRQAHRSQLDWTPVVTPALWRLVT